MDSIWQRWRASNRTIKPLRHLSGAVMFLAALQGGLLWTQSVADEQAVRQVLVHREVAWNTRDASAWVMDSAVDSRFTNILSIRFPDRASNEQRHAALFSTIFRRGRTEIRERLAHLEGTLDVLRSYFALDSAMKVPPEAPAAALGFTRLGRGTAGRGRPNTAYSDASGLWPCLFFTASTRPRKGAMLAEIVRADAPPARHGSRGRSSGQPVAAPRHRAPRHDGRGRAALGHRSGPRAGRPRRDRFGHIAQDQGVTYGFAWDCPTRDEAQEAALNACLNSGGSDCTVLAWFQNGCGAPRWTSTILPRERARERWSRRKRAPCKPAGLPEGSVAPWWDRSASAWAGIRTYGRGARAFSRHPEEGSGPTADAPRDEELTREERMQVQQGLAALGFDAGSADGMFVPRNRSAIYGWQQAKGLETTGYLSLHEAEVLAAAGAEYREQPASRETAEPAEPRNQVLYFAAAGPKCAELRSYLYERRAACWEETQSQPGCCIWTEHYHSKPRQRIGPARSGINPGRFQLAVQRFPAVPIPGRREPAQEGWMLVTGISIRSYCQWLEGRT